MEKTESIYQIPETDKEKNNSGYDSYRYFSNVSIQISKKPNHQEG